MMISKAIENELIIKQNLMETMILMKLDELVEPDIKKIIIELMETAEKNGFQQGYETALNTIK